MELVIKEFCLHVLLLLSKYQDTRALPYPERVCRDRGREMVDYMDKISRNEHFVRHRSGMCLEISRVLYYGKANYQKRKIAHFMRWLNVLPGLQTQRVKPYSATNQDPVLQLKEPAKLNLLV